MGKDVIIGYDGKARCAWAGGRRIPGVRYHDEVWGTRTYDESALFEALTLGVFQAGLSWSIVFGKREAFRKVFHEFDVARVAAMTMRDVDRLLQDPSIIRNRAKIQATVENARAMGAASPSLAELARSNESVRKRAPRSLADLPTSTPRAENFAKRLKSQGYHRRPRVCTRLCRTSAWLMTTCMAAFAPRTTPHRLPTRTETAMVEITCLRRRISAHVSPVVMSDPVLACGPRPRTSDPAR